MYPPISQKVSCVDLQNREFGGFVMGDTTEQHRASIGSFAARIASPRWRSRSPGTKYPVFLFSDLLQRTLLEQECSWILFKIWWAAVSILLDGILLCLAAPAALQILDNGILEENFVQNEPTPSKMHYGNQENLNNLAFFLAVLLKMLLISGDVETNPGPPPTVKGTTPDSCVILLNIFLQMFTVGNPQG